LNESHSKKKALLAPAIALTAFLFLVCSASAASASNVNIDENFGHFTLYRAGSSVIKLGSDLHATSVRVYGDRICFENAYLDSHPKEVSTLTLGIHPSADKPVSATLLRMNASAGTGGTVLELEMEDNVSQHVGLLVQNLTPNSYYALYEDGDFVHGRDSNDNGSWRYPIGDVSSTYTLKREQHTAENPPFIAPPGKNPLRIDVRVGKLRGGTFVPSERVGIGRIATVRIKLTSVGEPVEGADVGAWWIPRPTQAKTETIEISEVGGGVYQGSFSVPGDVAPGTYEVSASAEKPGYEKAIGYDTFHVARRVARPGPVEKAVGWMRKHPGMVAVAIIALLLLILIARE